MHITVHQDKVFDLLDVLMARWKSTPRQYPYNRPDAILPQAVAIPPQMRADKKLLANFYLYSCIYMRGGIESLQAFNALVVLWRDRPEFFDPTYIRMLPQPDIQEVLKDYIGWDSRQASINWSENSKRLCDNWGGQAINLAKNLGDYEEALRRMKNKRTKRELAEAGEDGEGFVGFQPKMVSMLLYFFDYERWIKPRFIYPSPADFHNFRLGLATGAIVVEVPEGRDLLFNEKLSAPWRAAVMAYLELKGADPAELANALWLYSLVMCGNSPLTETSGDIVLDNGDKVKTNHSGMFAAEELPHAEGVQKFLHPKFRKDLEATCLLCPFLDVCEYAIPARPYYSRGKFIFRPRPKVEEHIDRRRLQEPTYTVSAAAIPLLFDQPEA